MSERLPGRPACAVAPLLRLNRLLIAAMQVLDGIAHIHDNDSCHGDVSSENVLMTADGDGYLIDYDLADPAPALRRTRYGITDLGSRTLAAWQAADARAFEAMLAHWLDLRRAALFSLPCIDRQRNRSFG